MLEPKGHRQIYVSGAVLDLTFARTTRRHTDANVKSTPLASLKTSGDATIASEGKASDGMLTSIVAAANETGRGELSKVLPLHVQIPS
jgi:hypothetical protein